MTTMLLIGAGGFVGANVRFALTVWTTRRLGPNVPIGTIIANVAGSLLIGLILGLVEDREARLLLATGLLGAETTFSAFAVETVGLVDRGERELAVANIVLIVVGSPLAVVAGLALASLLRDAS